MTGDRNVGYGLKGNGTLGIERYFSPENGDVYSSVNWIKSDVKINDEDGKLLFVQKGVEFPSQWSELSKQVVASRYFFGQKGTSEREYSARQLIGRVSDTMAKWGIRQGYFSCVEDARVFGDEIATLALRQMMAFNSPVWFNVGTDRYLDESLEERTREAYIIGDDGRVLPMPTGNDREYPQTSACFIQSVDDTMEDILDLAKREGLLFRYGSGTGTNLSTLRSYRERISGGGKPSGPLAYLKFYDDIAGIVKSGGKTRRAAKMNILNIDHPDIKEFIWAKAVEQRKLHALMRVGYNFKDAEDTVAYQNANLSVRVSDEFMKAVENDEDWQTVPVHSKELANEMPRYHAKDLFRMVAEAAWECGDPGVQFHDTINSMHTVPNSGAIEASNPCSEYMHLTNSSCNLASINLMKFLNEDGTFDVEGFGRAIRTTVIAQDLEFDNSSYPTESIAKNSHEYRPLGTGFANLGSLLMTLGVPYDSDEGRAAAATIMAYLTGKVYETSTEIAEKVGPFKGFKDNKDPMLGVMNKHRSALNNIDRGKLPSGLEGLLKEAYSVWDNVVERGGIYGIRNSQASVLAPTGTISFMMDCDTTGIEPELALVKHKRLAERGILPIVNRTVPLALKRLGYSPEQIESISRHILEHETIEGSEVREEHLPIFDCALKPKEGTRVVSPYGHLKMVAAVQPFVSGAVSKTINLPEKTSVEDIEKMYMDAWKLGLKSVAVYRDRSKEGQPLSAGKLEEKLDRQLIPARRKLPNERVAIIHKFDIVGHEGYIHVGLYDDGSPGELFITMSKEGSTIGGLMDTVGTLTSLALQHGVPLEMLVEKFRHQRFEPAGLVYEGHTDIKTATSITDYIFNYLEKKFLGNDRVDKEDELGKAAYKASNEGSTGKGKGGGVLEGELGKFCPICESQMSIRGGCQEICSTCKHIDMTGCGGA